jgi:hypothetical protein
MLKYLLPILYLQKVFPMDLSLEKQKLNLRSKFNSLLEDSIGWSYFSIIENQTMKTKYTVFSKNFFTCSRFQSLFVCYTLSKYDLPWLIIFHFSTEKYIIKVDLCIYYNILHGTIFWRSFVKKSKNSWSKINLNLNRNPGFSILATVT